ncbi:MAG: hypothetical protein PHF86_04285 [Candidatus Nanoarchaeia archaeon]|jgi:hypothetical protein|nr:hypothetical protein [Candidatus Nanoarchaeia archaeon]
MNKEAIVQIADNILFDEFVKEAAVTRQWLKQHYKEINQKFLDFIKSRTFTQGRQKVPYAQLEPKLKEKVWDLFLKELEKMFLSEEEQIQKAIETVAPVGK